VTGTTWEHQREVRETLPAIVSGPQLGIGALSNAQTMSNLLAQLNRLTGFDAPAAGNTWPPPPGKTSGQSQWHSNDNASFGSRAGQVLECYAYSHDTRILIYLWTLPTRRVILIANNDAAEASYASLGNWWSGLN